MYSKPASGVFNSINIISDLLVIAYGIGLVKQLHSRRKAYAAAIVTGLGALSTAACAVRWIKTWKDGYQEQWLWFSVEICAGIVAACLPTLHAWLRLQVPMLRRRCSEEKDLAAVLTSVTKSEEDRDRVAMEDKEQGVLPKPKILV